jgi:ferredoxin
MNELKPDKKEETIPGKKAIKKLFPKVDSDKCNACGECIEVCPRDTIVLKNGKAFVELDKCTNCRICIKVCPENAFILE